jgi:hypothetical protein
MADRYTDEIVAPLVWRKFGEVYRGTPIGTPLEILGGLRGRARQATATRPRLSFIGTDQTLSDPHSFV